MGSLLKYRHNIYSQNGEDGVIAELCARLGISMGYCAEFGAWDGKFLSNTFALVERGWHAVAIEGDPTKFQDLVQTAAHFPEHLVPIQAYVEPEGERSLDNLLAQTPAPRDFDLLSIDIDSFDWQVWRGLRNFMPKIVIIEVNSSMPPGIDVVHSPVCQGSSFTATLRLGRKKGYTLVCHTGNMLFVRSDLVEKVGLPQREIDRPERLFIDEWVPPDQRPQFVRRLKGRLDCWGLDAFIDHNERPSHRARLRRVLGELLLGRDRGVSKFGREA
jgi:hypothetical protein